MIKNILIHPDLDITIEEFNIRYHDNLQSLNSIAKSLGTNHSFLSRHARKSGIKLRTPEEYSKLRHRYTPKKYNINLDFFRQWSPAMAWVLGYYAADGCISGRWQVSISQATNNLEGLEKIRDAIGFTGPITARGNQYDLIVSRVKFREILKSYNIVPRKSLKLEYPDIPLEFDRHFIRGYFDGDGHVYKSKVPNSVMPLIEAGFTCGSPLFANALHKKLTLAGINPTITERNRKGGWNRNPTWRIRMLAHRVTLLYHYFYDNAPSSIYLQRKHDKMLECVKVRQNFTNDDGTKPVSAGRGAPSYKNKSSC